MSEKYLFTVRILKIGTPKIITFIVQNGATWFYNAEINLKEADEMANNVGPDQAAL
ncbi:MAG: hypothetical protein AB2693_25085 [Candidatus Thiodiazotropha sp.]